MALPSVPRVKGAPPPQGPGSLTGPTCPGVRLCPSPLSVTHLPPPGGPWAVCRGVPVPCVCPSRVVHSPRHPWGGQRVTSRKSTCVLRRLRAQPMTPCCPRTGRGCIWNGHPQPMWTAQRTRHVTWVGRGRKTQGLRWAQSILTKGGDTGSPFLEQQLHNPWAATDP